jgi:putative lipoprotein
MRKLLLTGSLALLVLAGCNSSSKAPTTPTTPAAPVISNVSGSVTYRQKIALSNFARLELQLVDVSQGTSIIAQKVIAPAGQVPIRFDLPFDPARIGPKNFYVIQAVISDGERRYVAALQYPVLTHGSPSKVDIIVNPETTAGEKLKSEFSKLETRIGGMKRVTGERLTDDYNVGWDGFFDGAELRFVRQITDRGEKGRSNVRYAYLKGQPWIVVREEFPENSTRPSNIMRVGWAENGELVLREETGGDAEVTSEEAKALMDAAKQVAIEANAKKRR